MRYSFSYRVHFYLSTIETGLRHFQKEKDLCTKIKILFLLSLILVVNGANKSKYSFNHSYRQQHHQSIFFFFWHIHMLLLCPTKRSSCYLLSDEVCFFSLYFQLSSQFELLIALWFSFLLTLSLSIQWCLFFPSTLLKKYIPTTVGLCP